MYNCYYAKTHVCVHVKAIRSRKERSMITCNVFRKARNKNHRAKFTPSNLINEEQTDCHIFFFLSLFSRYLQK